MHTHTKLIILALLVFVVVLMHFVPVYSTTGVIIKDSDVAGGYSCPQYVHHTPDYYRIIPDGLQGFQADKHYLVPESQQCGPRPVELRLYLW